MGAWLLRLRGVPGVGWRRPLNGQQERAGCPASTVLPADPHWRARPPPLLCCRFGTILFEYVRTDSWYWTQPRLKGPDGVLLAYMLWGGCARARTPACK